MAKSPNRSFKALREILLAEDEERLNQFSRELQQIKEQLSDEEALLDTLDPVIANLLERKMVDSRDEMADALAPVMSEAIKRQITEAKDDMVDSLYPIIGKTIRKSVAEAMKGLVDNVNSKIEGAIRKGLLLNRVKSRITGVSEGEMLVKGALPFKIQEIFLIHKMSGLLISHVSSAKAGTTVDKDLISGMLTAIKDFVSDAFKGGVEQDLGEIQYGDSKILLEAGRYSYLALVVTGVEPDDFRDDLYSLGRRIHNRFHKLLRQFDGDMSSFREIQKPIESFLNKYNASKSKAASKKAGSYLIYLLLAAAVIALGVCGARFLPKFIANGKLKSTIHDEMRSQLSYYDDIRIKARNNIITLEGSVDSLHHVNETADFVKSIAGVEEVRNKLRISKANTTIYKEINKRLNKHPELRRLMPVFILDDDGIVIEGEVPDIATRREIAYLVSDIPGIRIITNNLNINSDYLNLEEINNIFLAERMVFFELNSVLVRDEQKLKLDEIFDFIKPLSGVKLKLLGYSDNISTEEYNRQMSKSRAEAAKAYLEFKGVPSEIMVVEFYGQSNPLFSNSTEEGRSKNRRVEFQIIGSR